MFVGAASAATPVNTKATVGATVPTGPQSNSQVSSSGPRVVWEQVDATTLIQNVWVKNLKTGNTQVVAANPQGQSSPDILQDLVTWQQYNPSTTYQNIYIRNITSGAVGPVNFFATDESNAKLGLNQSGAIVVWQQSFFPANFGFQQIYSKKVAATGTVWGLAGALRPSFFSQTNPDVSRNMAVWQEFNPAQGALDQNVRFFDLENSNSAFIDPSDDAQTVPKISGHNIVWVENNRIMLGNTDVYWLLGNSGQRILPGILQVQSAPDISGNRIIFVQQKLLTFAQQIWVYNLVSGNAAIVTSSILPQIQPAIDGNIVTWTNVMAQFDNIQWRNIVNGQHGKLT
jgi:hypothetical protein